MLDRLSIRAKIAAAFAAAMLLVLVAAGLFLYLEVRSDLNESLDENLQSRADDLAAAAGASAQGALNLEAQRVVEGEDAFSEILQVGDGSAGAPSPTDDEVLTSTLPADAGPSLSAKDVERGAQEPTFFPERNVPGIAGEARILARPIASDGRMLVVVVGATTEDREETLAGLRYAFLIGTPIALLLASGLGYLLAGRAMAPVSAMRRRASEITLERSGDRLPLPQAVDEIHQLGETLNTMLDRIESSLQRERAFVADAGHELRTPLAILRAELELAEREGRSLDELRAAIRSAGEETDRLSQLAEDLLVIARSDQGRLPIEREAVNLGELLNGVRQRFARRAEDAGRKIVVDAPAGATANLDPLRVEQALGNLVDNALRHGEGEVELIAARSVDRVELTVRDQGPGFPDDFADDAFERFSRADEGRTGGGTGLGLAIVRAIARAHGGEAMTDGAGVMVGLPT